MVNGGSSPGRGWREAVEEVSHPRRTSTFHVPTGCPEPMAPSTAGGHAPRHRGDRAVAGRLETFREADHAGPVLEPRTREESTELAWST